MRLAIRLAERGHGRTAPNPSVGAVIVNENSGEVVGRGWTQPGGRPHAEVEAIARAGGRARGATLYVTLEPCAHHGKTPPCVEAVLKAGIARVVCGIVDPDPRVGGRGLSQLQDAGIEVRRGVLRAAANWVTLGHILRVTERRPLIQLKLAVAANGKIARGGTGQPAWVTGQLARQHGHLLRAKADAILIGSGTLRDDNPNLSCRLPGLGRQSPVRVILSSGLDIPEHTALLRVGATAPVWWYTASDQAKQPTHQNTPTYPSQITQSQIVAGGGVVLPIRTVGGKLWLPAVLENLVERGITRLLVEGGPAIWAAFGHAELVDEIVLFHARAELNAVTTPTMAKQAIQRYVGNTELPLTFQRRLGSDDMFIFRRRILSDRT